MLTLAELKDYHFVEIKQGEIILEYCESNFRIKLLAKRNINDDGCFEVIGVSIDNPNLYYIFLVNTKNLNVAKIIIGQPISKDVLLSIILPSKLTPVHVNKYGFTNIGDYLIQYFSINPLIQPLYCNFIPLNSSKVIGINTNTKSSRKYFIFDMLGSSGQEQDYNEKSLLNLTDNDANTLQELLYIMEKLPIY